MPKLATSAQTDKLLQFFVHVAQGMNIRESATKVGYSTKWAKGYSYGYVKKYQDYLQWLQAHFAQAVAKKIGIDQERVLEEIESVAMANLMDYIVIEGTGTKRKARFKDLHELTSEQMRAVDPVSAAGKLVGWKFRDRDGKLTELAKTMGLLNEKIIMEHRHRHLHVHTDLSQVPLDKLEALEAQFEEVLLLEHEKPQQPDQPKGRKNGNGSGH